MVSALRYETEGGNAKRMKSRPMTYARAREQLLHYERRGVPGKLVEDKEATAEQLAEIENRRYEYVDESGP